MQIVLQETLIFLLTYLQTKLVEDYFVYGSLQLKTALIVLINY